MYAHSPKPQIPLLSGAVALNPGKNYAYQLLYRHIEALTPRRSLDAGCGELRTFPMFPAYYVGITHNRPVFFEGVAKHREVIALKGFPEVYLMRLESDFSFIAPVDLAVCTFTIGYTDDRLDVLRRLSDRVQTGGSLILVDDIPFVDAMASAIAANYQNVEIVYFCQEPDRFVSGAEELQALTEREMAAPNVPQGHAHFYLLATGKKAAPSPQGPRPAVTNDNGLWIVNSDVPRLKMD